MWNKNVVLTAMHLKVYGEGNCDGKFEEKKNH